MASKAFCSAKTSTSTIERRLAGLRDDVGVVGDLVFLRGHQQHFHRALRVLAGAGVDDLVVEIDVLDVERDVLLGFPVDRLAELGFGHRRQRDLLDDHGIAGQRGDDVLGLELLVGEEAADGIGDRAAIDDGAVDNTVGRNGLDPNGRHPEALPGGFQFDGLDGTRPDVEAHEAFCSAEQHVSLSPDATSVANRIPAAAALADPTNSALNTGIGSFGGRRDLDTITKLKPADGSLHFRNWPTLDPASGAYRRAVWRRLAGTR